MPRNDQLARQWHILRRLERGRSLTLAELAAGLPDDFPKHLRTLRRDLEALDIGGFPLVTERVDGHTRWRLLDGARAPAIGFSSTELMALAVTRDLLRPLEGTAVRAALDSALAKATAALPPGGTDLVRQMRDWLSVHLGPYKPYRKHRDTIDRLTRALAERRTVQMRYFTASRQATTRREVDPYRFRYLGDALYLDGYDHLRRRLRTFAVERIRALTVTDHAFQLPLDFDIDEALGDALLAMHGRPVSLELVFDRPTAAWVRDRIWHRSQRLEKLPGGRLRMTLRAADTRELLGWILSFGAGVRVVHPASLRDRVHAEAARIARGPVS
jgi:predicted DNA-binding transcriptional regulator YafY